MSRVIHFEIHASDPAKLADFYKAAFGWKFTHFPQMDYWLIDSGDAKTPGINGGLLRRRGAKPADGQPINAFVCTIGVASIDADLARVLDAGATLTMPKMTVPGIGWSAYVKDPDGNILGLHQHDPSAH